MPLRDEAAPVGHLAAENEILKSKIGKPLRFTDEEKVRPAKIGKRPGRKALADIGCIVKPDTILKWFREMVAKKFDGSKNRRPRGRPSVDPEIEKLVLRFTEENPGWGDDRVQGPLANLGPAPGNPATIDNAGTSGPYLKGVQASALIPKLNSEDFGEPIPLILPPPPNH